MIKAHFIKILILLWTPIVLSCSCGGKNSPVETAQNSGSCVASLTHTNPIITRAYKESFTMFGAFLLKYQEVLNNQQDIVTEFNKIDIPGIGAELNNLRYFGTKVSKQRIGDLSAIDKEIKNRLVREVWQKWCAHPDNFLSWLLYPILWKEANNIDELTAQTNEFGYSSDDYMISWFDDGFWMMSKIMGIKITGGPQEHSTWQADPKKWLIKLDGDKAITR